MDAMLHPIFHICARKSVCCRLKCPVTYTVTIPRPQGTRRLRSGVYFVLGDLSDAIRTSLDPHPDSGPQQAAYSSKATRTQLLFGECVRDNSRRRVVARDTTGRRPRSRTESWGRRRRAPAISSAHRSYLANEEHIAGTAAFLVTPTSR
jgi:hypothetical protein